MADIKTTPAKPEDELELTDEWDKTFDQSPLVHHEKVTFHNHFGITLAADLYRPLTEAPEGGYPAIAVSGPYGAVKEQASGLYAQTMAENGFLTIAFDPSYTGESGGQPRYVSSPDLNPEDFQAAVDYLVCRDDVNAERVGIIGICGWGGIALNATAADTRVKATVASTMYDLTRVGGNGYFDAADDSETRNKMRQMASAQRTADYSSGTYALMGGCLPYPAPDDAPQYVKDYSAYYKTKRGYAARSLNSNDGWQLTGRASGTDARPDPAFCLALARVRCRDGTWDIASNKSLAFRGRNAAPGGGNPRARDFLPRSGSHTILSTECRNHQGARAQPGRAGARGPRRPRAR